MKIKNVSSRGKEYGFLKRYQRKKFIREELDRIQESSYEELSEDTPDFWNKYYANIGKLYPGWCDGCLCYH